MGLMKSSGGSSLIFRAIKEIGSNFYSLDDLLKDFVKKNNLKKPASVIDTSRGKLITWKHYTRHCQAILYTKGSQDIFHESRLQPYIGGDGSHMYTCKEVSYCLEGMVNMKKVDLEAEVREAQDYILEKQVPSCFAPKPKINGEPEVSTIRNDKEKYWFVTDAKK